MIIRGLIIAAGAAGTSGIILSAMAAHSAGGAGLVGAAHILTIHGAALLALAAATDRGIVTSRMALAIGLGWVTGLLLFCGDLSLRTFWAVKLFSFAAPTGGTILIASWLLLMLSAIVSRR